MSEYLKGNYPLEGKNRPRQGGSQQEPDRKTVTEEFEARALERLGGSIAFVVKSSFVWNGENGEEPGERAS